MPISYDKAGNRTRRKHRGIFVDLSIAPRFDSELPPDIMYSIVAIKADDGQPMPALVNPTLIATTEEVIDRIAAARQEFVDAGIARDQDQQVMIDALNAQVTKMAGVEANYQTMLTQQAQLLTALAARKVPVPLGNITIAANLLYIALGGEKTVTNVSCPGLKATDAGNLILTPQTLPSGYGLRSYSIPADDKINLVLQCPALSVGGTPLVFAVQAYR